MIGLDPWEVGAAVFGVACVWLTVRENVLCWPLGLVNVSLLGVVFLHSRFYAGVGLQVAYFALGVYGWHEWLHGGPQHDTLRVARAPRAALASLLLAAALTWPLGLLLRQAGGTLPFLDSATTCFSLAAQWMLTRKWIENWLVWIAVDAVGVGMYLHQRLYPTAALYTVFLGLAVSGLVAWRRSLAESRPA